MIFELNNPILPISEVFPDEDFCIYKDYPFDQMVYTYFLCNNCKSIESLKRFILINPTYSCVYLWINQYYHLVKHQHANNTVEMVNLLTFLNSKSFKNIKNCHFEKRLALCKRSEFHLKEIWEVYDYFILNKKIQTGVKALTYLIALFSIPTNTLVIKTIFLQNKKTCLKI